MRTAALVLGAALLLPAWGQSAEPAVGTQEKKEATKDVKETKRQIKKDSKAKIKKVKDVKGTTDDDKTPPADKTMPVDKTLPADKTPPAAKTPPADKTPPPAKKPAAAEQPAAAEATAGGGGHFSVVEIKLATEVKEREPVSPGTSFGKGATVYTWVKLNVQDPTTTLTMKWYRDNALVSTSKSIEIKKAPGYRAWLATRVAAPGSWKVEIVDADDKPVQSETFTVQ
jgi:hypothetical protein